MPGSRHRRDLLAGELQTWLDETPFGADSFSGRNTRRTGALLTRCPSSVAVVAHQLVLDVVDATLWPKKTTYQLHLTQSIAIGPGSTAQKLHRDHWCFDMFPFPRDIDVEVSTIWGSTTSSRKMARRASCPTAIAHPTPSSTPRPTRSPRRCRAVRLCCTSAPPCMEEERTPAPLHGSASTLDEVKQFPEHIQRLLGYEVGAYALGYIDGGRSPMTVLRQGDPEDAQSFAPR